MSSNAVINKQSHVDIINSLIFSYLIKACIPVYSIGYSIALFDGLVGFVYGALDQTSSTKFPGIETRVIPD